MTASSSRVTAVVGLLGTLLLAGCGNIVTTEIIGASGVSLGRSGVPQLHIAVCSGSVGIMYLYGPHQGDEKTSQEPIGTWEAKNPLTVDTVLRLDDNPGANWTVKQDPGALEPGAAYAAFGGSTTEDQAISQVDFTMGRLTRLSADHVSYYHAKTVSVSAFHDTVCR